MIWKLAFHNIFRHRTRTLLNFLIIASSLISIIIFRGFTEHNTYLLKRYGVENQYGHLQLGTSNLWNKQSPRLKDQLIEIQEPLINKVKSLPEFESIYARLSLQGLIVYNDSQIGAKIIGFDPEKEKHFQEYVPVIEGEYLKSLGAKEIMVGAGVKARLKVRIGEQISVVTQTIDGIINAMDLTVKGIFQTGVSTIDNQVGFVPLNVTQVLLDTQKAEVLVIRLRDIDLAPNLKDLYQSEVKKINPQLEIKSWKDLADLFNKTEEFYDVQNAIVEIILTLLTVLAILNTVGMTVFERTGEIGTQRALGMRRGEIVVQFLFEGFYLAFFGSILGIALSVVIAFLLNHAGMTIVMPGASIDLPVAVIFKPLFFRIAVEIAFASTILGTIFPAWRASQIPVVDALRKNI